MARGRKIGKQRFYEMKWNEILNFEATKSNNTLLKESIELVNSHQFTIKS